MRQYVLIATVVDENCDGGPKVESAQHFTGVFTTQEIEYIMEKALEGCVKKFTKENTK